MPALSISPITVNLPRRSQTVSWTRMGTDMASYRGHLAFSSSLGAALGGLAYWQLNFDWGTSALAAGLTAVGGMMPDLDSDSGVPVREMFGLASVFGPLLLLSRLLKSSLLPEEILVVLAVLYLAIRYGLSYLFKKVTVHRGMFHSIPGMLIAGLLIFLVYHNPQLAPRILLSAGIMIGFVSHLLLDELCSVDFRGLKPSLNQFAGSALKFRSQSKWATALTYVILVGLSFLVFQEVKSSAASLADGASTDAMAPPSIDIPPPPQ
jgi:membrane-bound metal-dependent hydrolase YbcI (DUF457 family)